MYKISTVGWGRTVSISEDCKQTLIDALVLRHINGGPSSVYLLQITVSEVATSYLLPAKIILFVGSLFRNSEFNLVSSYWSGKFAK